MRFEVYDVDSTSRDLNKHDFLGCMECSLAEIVSHARLQKPLLQGPSQNKGLILVSAEEMNACKEEVTLQFSGRKLDRKDFFGKSDPFLQFYRTNEDGSLTVVHKTEVIKHNLNPTWKPFTISVRSFCNGDYDRCIKVECFDWNQNGSHNFIGEFAVTLRELTGKSNIEYDCINPKKKAKKKSYKNSGKIFVMTCRVEKVHTFLDYIKGGHQINCVIAIDFTASNGDPRQMSSLHYNNPYRENLYQSALRAVGEILQEYDSDKLFPALGFGARFPDGTISHEFSLNGNPASPVCSGIDGVMSAYAQAINSVQLYGPTNFAPCINHVARLAAQEPNEYYILLILTDGVISDMYQTTEAIVSAASLPISIIIVSIGDADFEAMDILDGDDVRLSSRGRYAERDIVQFVPFSEFLTGANMKSNQARLAKEVLAEIPDQFLSYMKTRHIKPRTPLIRSDTIPSAPPVF